MLRQWNLNYNFCKPFIFNIAKIFFRVFNAKGN